MASAMKMDAFIEGYASILLVIGAYGTYLAIASLTCYLLLRRGKDYAGCRLMLMYTALMAVLTTTWVFASAYTSARALSGAHDPNVAFAPATVIAKLASTLQVLVSDGALLYRAWVLWTGDMRVMGPLLFVYVFQVGSGIVRNIICFVPSMAMVLEMVEMGMLGTTLALNLFATLAITGCLVAVRRRMHVHGATAHRTMVTTALLAGSTAVYTLLGGVSALYAFRAMGATAPIAALWQIFAFFSPALIILRVVLGMAFESGKGGIGGEQTLRSFVTPPAPSYASSRISIEDACEEKEVPVFQVHSERLCAV